MKTQSDIINTSSYTSIIPSCYIEIVYNCLLKTHLSLTHSLTQVSSITYNDDSCTVETKSGESLTADKVICALPLSTYQSKFVQFEPELPKEKLKAIDRLGAGLIEKVSFTI